MYSQALDVIESVFDQDFVCVYLHAEVRAAQKEFTKAIKLLNRYF